MFVVAPENNPAAAKELGAEKRNRQGRQPSSSNNDRRSAEIQSQALPLQRCKETRSNLQTDREDEKDQPELTRKIEHTVFDLPAKMPKEQTCKKHSGAAQPDAADLDRRNGKPEQSKQRTAPKPRARRRSSFPMSPANSSLALD